MTVWLRPTADGILFCRAEGAVRHLRAAAARFAAGPRYGVVMSDAEPRGDDNAPGGARRDDWVDWATGGGVLLSLIGVGNGLATAVRERVSVGLAWAVVSGVLLVLVLLTNSIVRTVEGHR